MEDAPAIAIDMSFDKLMQPKEICSLSSQIRHAYGYNKRAKCPFKLYLTNYDEEKGATAQILKKDSGYDRWIMRRTSKDYVDVFGSDKVVYLSSESDCVLEYLDPKVTYIIGGLVDKNRYKGLCFEEAQKRNVKTAQLPIGKFMAGATRKVITVNQVFDILLKFQELKDWGKAFSEVMPARKGYRLKKDQE
eukprot:CAMPEP_0184493420 /NCGR_PEP_ID=MMETSP0113_2-20130426/25964_1 /TAXON_ID=91329 /ORGANISM="Norrisiella sphaerica, Strain BC52" /LENGTH=190 /DNA_ID=CAMNT_0026878671 /DNA_START=102 /DNA_END=674 /DNA_ORIENTATION=-